MARQLRHRTAAAVVHDQDIRHGGDSPEQPSSIKHYTIPMNWLNDLIGRLGELHRERVQAFARFLARRFVDDRCFETAGALSYTRSEEHTSELQSLMRISYAVFCLKKKNINNINTNNTK